MRSPLLGCFSVLPKRLPKHCMLLLLFLLCPKPAEVRVHPHASDTMHFRHMSLGLLKLPWNLVLMILEGTIQAFKGAKSVNTLLSCVAYEVQQVSQGNNNSNGAVEAYLDCNQLLSHYILLHSGYYDLCWKLKQLSMVTEAMDLGELTNINLLNE